MNELKDQAHGRHPHVVQSEATASGSFQRLTDTRPLPRPFCGTDVASFLLIEGDADCNMAVVCWKCGSAGPSVGKVHVDRRKSQAIKIWNKRARPQE